MTQDKPTVIGPRPLSWIAVAGLALSVLGALLLLVAAAGYRFDLWHFRFSLLSLMRWAAYAAAAGVVLSLVGLGRSLPDGVRRGVVPAALGVLVGAVAFWMPAESFWKVRTLPFIHDITTDTENPPEFRAVVAEREASGANPHLYAGEGLAREQQRGYPDLGPLIVEAEPAAAFDAAVETARSFGWEIVAVEPEEGRLEATDTTFWFGFKDDVVIRVTPTVNGGSRVDMRSLSRVGRSDVGKNAERIRAYTAALGERLG